MQPLRLLAVVLCVSCSSKTEDSAVSDDSCVIPQLIATDIDETLTTSDAEWLQQLADPSHVPEMRPDANTLMQGYAELGYRVVYITARGEDPVLADGRTSREATWDWLTDQGFPGQPEDLFLAQGIGAAGEVAVEYKSGVLAELSQAGSDAVWAYGNADSDIEAFLQHGIPEDRIFLVGELAGTMGVIGLTDEQAYSDHMPGQLAGVEPAASPDCAQ